MDLKKQIKCLPLQKWNGKYAETNRKFILGFIPVCMAFLFSIWYYVLHFNFSLKTGIILKLCL
ncbi:hypothetical protein P3549_23035, partial [Vibrio parahaemolyticus]|nr:hypothetical protein [Vibrio parahaemolyticus]